jgi:hypothetical protein
VRQGHDHVFLGDQVLDGEVFLALLDGAAALVAKLLADLHQFPANHLHQLVGAGKDL